MAQSLLDVPVYDIKYYKNCTFLQEFSTQIIDDAGTVIGPFPLTGYELILEIENVYGQTLTISSEEDPVDHDGSYIRIDNVANGDWSYKLTPITNSKIKKKTGTWDVKRKSGPEDINKFVQGSVEIGTDTKGDI